MRLRPLNILRKENPVSFLTKTFFKEHDKVMLHFTPVEQLELTDHFIQMMDCLNGFANEIDNKNAANYSDKYIASVDQLLVKYGSRFKPYVESNFIQYFLLPLVLVTKAYYEDGEIARKENEALTVDEAKALAFVCKAQLNENRVALLTSDVHLIEKKESPTKTLDANIPTETEPQNIAAIDGNLLAIIQQHLSPFKEHFNKEADYNTAVQAIALFLTSGQGYLGKALFIKSGSKRKIAFAMGEIWRSSSNEIISVEYLLLYTQLFSIFSKIEIDKSNLFSNNLYKYSISKT